ncbi:MAG: pectinesterase family protein [Anaerolineae bacterium]|nr:pectinesterase family protein [Anaerolineae bacterium]
MKTRVRWTLNLTLTLLTGVALVAVSQATPAQSGMQAVVAYQGEVRLNGAPYTGTAYFKFAVVSADGNTTYWSNDGTSSGGAEPTAAVALPVSDGLFSVLLGDTALDGMTEALAANVFGEHDRALRVWFSTSGGGPFDQLAPDTRIAAVPYALQAELARDADTVDGLHAAELATRYQNVVVVAKSGGDYASVQAAIDSIAGATASNPYLVWVAPGVYEEQVTMKPYVHLQGAGQQATVLDSTASSSSPIMGTLKLASDASLRDLTLSNHGTGTYNIALLVTAGTTRALVADVTVQVQGGGVNNYGLRLAGSGTGVTLQQVTVLAEGGTYNAGLVNLGGAAARLEGGSFTARGGTWARAIVSYQDGTTLDSVGVTALGEGGSENTGLYNDLGAIATLQGGSFTGSGGTLSQGIANIESDTILDAQGVTARGELGFDKFGLYNASSAYAFVTQSKLWGESLSIYADGGSVSVSHSRLLGGPVSAGVTCIGVSSATTFYTSGCP